MKKILLLLISFSPSFFYYPLFGQLTRHQNKFEERLLKVNGSYSQFHRAKNYFAPKYLLASNFNYPLSKGDFWEYLTTDTTTFMGLTGINYSVIKEVIGDTTMPNELTYKILKWYKCANSVNEPPQFEFQRKDSTGKVFIYYNNKDNLLYDFNKNVGEVYPSQYSGYTWNVENKYLVAGFNKQEKAIDLWLRDSSNNIVRQETIIDNFGLTYYKGDINISSKLPEGNFWGGIINDTT